VALAMRSPFFSVTPLASMASTSLFKRHSTPSALLASSMVFLSASL